MDEIWVEEQQDFGVGDSAFLICFHDENRGATRYQMRLQPAYTNRSNEPKLNGWCGTYNNLSTTAFGAWKVAKIAKSGRYLLRSLEGQELKDFLNEMGYPELIK